MERLLTSSVSLSKHDLIGPDQRKQRSHKELWRQTRLSESLIYDAAGAVLRSAVYLLMVNVGQKQQTENV